MIRTAAWVGAWAGAILALGGMASAQALTGEAAEPLLFTTGKAVVEIVPNAGLPEDQAAILATVGAAQPFYGAIAISPDEGLMVEATVAAANHHTTEAATAAALAGCEAKRKGATPCAVVALIRPEGWEPRPFQLSSGATTGFVDDYLKTRGARAFAASPATGLWGIGTGDAAAAEALAACAAKGPAQDCTVVVQD